MKIKAYICALALLLSAPLLQGQGQVSTRKHRLADFTDKVTQVVLTGNEMLSSALREEVVAGWTASAFEFCSLERFETIKDQDRYYFLIIAETGGVSYLTLRKGSFEVISLPLAAAAAGSGRELTYLSGLIKTVQDFTLEAMESEIVAYGMEAWVNKNYDKWGHTKQIRIAREDLASNVTEQDLARYLDSDFIITEDATEADQDYLDAQYNTLVGYVVSPLQAEKGSYCYKMLFEAETHTLYYFSKHRITARKGAGFLPEDLKRLARKR
ncbi:MAG: hypothetical protein K5843_08585 [Bacteroidales bacterium]|nr:hypothetical protein [Bacteroidales bacterium]